MAAKASTAVKVFLQVVDIGAGPRPAVEWLTEIGVAQSWASNGEEAREWAERIEQLFLQALRRELNELTELGRFAPFAFNSSSDYMLQGSAFIEPKDSPAVREAKGRRARFPDYAQALRELSPAVFEALCAGILELVGVDSPRLTPTSGDEGIDFYGRLRLEDRIFPQDIYPTIQKQLGVWMIGQAKRYQATRVSTPDIRELVGSIELARSRAYGDGPGKYGDLEVRACDPVFYLFFTTGRLSADSWRLLRRSGVVAMDGEMVASFLADREIGIASGEFDGAKFQEWVQEHQI
jgi:hypothetical protein